jgi:hypothetical protein
MCLYLLTPSLHSFCSVDDAFPVVTFNFEDDLTLNVYPREYLFKYEVTAFLFPASL